MPVHRVVGGVEVEDELRRGASRNRSTNSASMAEVMADPVVPVPQEGEA